MELLQFPASVQSEVGGKHNLFMLDMWSLGHIATPQKQLHIWAGWEAFGEQK